MHRPFPDPFGVPAYRVANGEAQQQAGQHVAATPVATSADSSAKQQPVEPAPRLPWDVRLMNASTRLLYLLLGVGVLFAALWGMVHASVFQLREIEVDANMQRISREEVQQVLRPYLQQSLFLVDITEAQRAVEHMPWVRKAVVRRVFPDRLAVGVQEQQEVAYWASNHAARDDMRLLNAEGDLFASATGGRQRDDLPVLYGTVDEQTQQVLAMYRVLAPLFAPLQQHLAYLELSVADSWRVMLDSGTILELGQGSEAELRQRIQLYVGTVAKVIQTYQRVPADVQLADLRYRKGYALQIKGIRVQRNPNTQMATGS